MFEINLYYCDFVKLVFVSVIIKGGGDVVGVVCVVLEIGEYDYVWNM